MWLIEELTPVSFKYYRQILYRSLGGMRNTKRKICESYSDSYIRTFFGAISRTSSDDLWAKAGNYF